MPSCSTVFAWVGVWIGLSLGLGTLWALWGYAWKLRAEPPEDEEDPW